MCVATIRRIEFWLWFKKLSWFLEKASESFKVLRNLPKALKTLRVWQKLNKTSVAPSNRTNSFPLATFLALKWTLNDAWMKPGVRKANATQKTEQNSDLKLYGNFFFGLFSFFYVSAILSEHAIDPKKKNSQEEFNGSHKSQAERNINQKTLAAKLR